MAIGWKICYHGFLLPFYWRIVVGRLLMQPSKSSLTNDSLLQRALTLLQPCIHNTKAWPKYRPETPFIRHQIFIRI